MRAITENQSKFLPPFRIPRPGTGASADFLHRLSVVRAGIDADGAAFALGLGAEIGQILAMAGLPPRSFSQRGKRVAFVQGNERG